MHNYFYFYFNDQALYIQFTVRECLRVWFSKLQFLVYFVLFGEALVQLIKVVDFRWPVESHSGVHFYLCSGLYLRKNLSDQIEYSPCEILNGVHL